MDQENKSSNHSLQPRLVDTTLREGEQTPGFAFSIDEKIQLAVHLSKAGIHELEVGTPIMGEREQTAIREIVGAKLKAKIRTWNRSMPEDIEASLSCGVKNLFISIPVSDLQIESRPQRTRRDVLNQLEQSILLATGEDCDVVPGLQDATRADPAFLKEVFLLCESLGIQRIRPSDTVGILSPETSNDFFRNLKNNHKLQLESHCHNDFGLATANTISAWRGGASYLDVTVLGVGERAGNAPLEEVVLCLEKLYSIPTGVDLRELKPLSQFVAAISGRPIPESKPIVGEAIFTHESGIHVAGVLKNPLNYEPYKPEEVGAKRKIVIGKHSGKKAILLKLSELGLDATATEVSAILDQIKEIASAKKGALTEEEILGVFHRIKKNKKDKITSNGQESSAGF